MDDLLSYFSVIQNNQPPIGAFDLTRLGLSLLVAFLLSRLVAELYRRFSVVRSNDLSFLISLVLLGTIAAFIMQAVGNNLARAFSLAGALSIVRFRNAIKDTMDIVVIFFVMAIGIASGANFLMLAIVSTLTISILWWLTISSIFRFTEETRPLLQFSAANSAYFLDLVSTGELSKYIQEAKLRNVQVVGDGMNLYSYDLLLSTSLQPEAFLTRLQEISSRDDKNELLNNPAIYFE